MITMMTYDTDKEEQQLLLYDSENAVAYYSDERLEKISMEREEEVRAFLEESGLLDAAMMEITNEEGLQLTKDFRKVQKEADLMLIADERISPMRYVTPEIRATSLLLRPFRREDGEQVVRDFLTALIRERNQADTNQRLVYESREGKIAIPYAKIYCIEVKGKKLFIRTKYREYPKSGSLESMEQELPKNFLRCHRSYIVNTDYITQVKLAENAVILEHNIRIPLSRTYKPEMKAYLERNRRGSR